METRWVSGMSVPGFLALSDSEISGAALLLVVSGVVLGFGGALWTDRRIAEGRSGGGTLAAALLILLGTFLALAGVFIGIAAGLA